MADHTPKKVTPMMEQYLHERSLLDSQTLLFFRLGDFYELFHEDAEKASAALGITLTKRQGTPMAGIPYHAAENYINKLLTQGFKVAICEQVEPAKAGKLVKRELTRVLTPGTTLEESQLDARENHYLLAVNFTDKGIQAAWIDVSTGHFAIAAEPTPNQLLATLDALQPKEILIPEQPCKLWEKASAYFTWRDAFDTFSSGKPITELPEFLFDLTEGRQITLSTLNTINLQGFGIEEDHLALGCAGALLTYVTENLCQRPENLHRIEAFSASQTLLLDPATQRNLEIFKSTQATREGSLLHALDATVTAAGARLLEKFLATPTLDLNEIQRRQRCVSSLVQEPDALSELHSALKNTRDLTRIIGRLQNKIRNPRELGGIRETLLQLPCLKEQLHCFNGIDPKNLANRITPLDTLSEQLEKALSETLPGKITDGGIIRNGYDAELDRLRELTRNSKHWVAQLEQEEQCRTGIKNLKIKYNGTFGYFIEVTKSNVNAVPENYIRKQTLANAERYYTLELKEKEKEILSAEELALSRESALFQNLVELCLNETTSLLETAQALAEADLFAAFAQQAITWRYTCPTLDNSNILSISQGRHPVVEQMIKLTPGGLGGSHAFVPNDTLMKSDAEQILLLTGPNMAGKSTYIRQVALITLMAQIGSWVPADSCHIGLVDRIFSRVGASDELARGNSTFMVEMNETANIVNNATPNSLIILDEIGRGTSTYDGLSIAWSVLEHLHGPNPSGPRTLFATHYHEITQLEKALPRLRNFSVAVKEWNDQIIFVRQVISGAADRSYGIQVARLAGLPQSIIDRAKVLLEELETENRIFMLSHPSSSKKKKATPSQPEEAQLSFF